MNSSTEIIVYRNPMERVFWNSIATGTAVPVIAGLVVFFVIVILTSYFMIPNFHWQRRNRNAMWNHLPWVLGLIAGILTTWGMWL